MADVKWIKIVTDIFDDEKILLIESMPEGDSILVVWLKLLCLAGKANNSGVLMLNDKIAYTDEMLSTIFRRKLNTVRLSLETFERLGMIEIVNDAITIPNWDKHQSLDALEKRRERQKLYMQDRRAKQKLLANCEANSKANGETNVSPLEGEGEGEGDKEGDKDKEGERDKRAKRKRFTPPTLDEVAEYCRERQNGINPQRFIDHYESNGWMVGQNKMQNWKASVRTWEQREKKSPAQYDYSGGGESL